jgi:hypothetical protein
MAGFILFLAICSNNETCGKKFGPAHLQMWPRLE